MTPAPGPRLVAAPRFSTFYQREPASFLLRNDGAETVTLPSGAPWKIVDAMGRTIFAPRAIAVLVPLPPGESLTWCWDQRDEADSQVEPGNYAAVFDQFEVRAELPIDAQLGSTGFFTFGFPDPSAPTLRIFMTDPQAIRDAIESFHGRSAKSIPVGPLIDDRPGRSPYDPQWSWHFAPPAVQMIETAAAQCDGMPQAVEDQLDAWLGRGICCAGSARVIALE